MEITEREVAKRLYANKVKIAFIESNNGGRGFARNVDKELLSIDKIRRVRIDSFHQSANKESRILSNATNVMNNILFPEGWNRLWMSAYASMVSFQRIGKNKNDDLQDCLTLLIEKIIKGVNYYNGTLMIKSGK
jgi:predicted phage terminase large subunit-like protein